MRNEKGIDCVFKKHPPSKFDIFSIYQRINNILAIYGVDKIDIIIILIDILNRLV